MFDNPEKLFIIMIIALFIFGPQKLIGLGGAMGRAIRDFRTAVRDAHEQFSVAVDEAQREAQKTEEAYTMSEPAALPAPEVMPPAVPSEDAVPPAAAQPASAVPAGAAEDDDHEDRYSLTSEPSAKAVLEALQQKGPP